MNAETIYISGFKMRLALIGRRLKTGLTEIYALLFFCVFL